MIFEFQDQSNIQIIEDIFNLIPSKRIGLILWFLSSIVVLFYSVYKLNKKAKIIDNLISLLMPSIIYVGTFIYTYGIIDEVSINLEHPYNLYHFGKFSMSPDKMVDGTIEVLYYLIHTPFAQSQSSLVLGNFLISLIVGWLHIFVLWRFQLTRSFLNNLILLSCFSLSFPIISIFSSGFGNSLISLLFLISICFCLKNKLMFSLLVSGLLPLIRPDGILWSFTNILTITLIFRRKTKLISYPKAFYVSMTLLPFLSTVVYLLSYKIAYGHFIPTPILFKSFKLSMLPMFQLLNFRYYILNFLLGIPLNGIAFLVLASLIYFVINKHSLIEQNETIRTLMVYTLSTSLIFVFYNFTKATIGDFSGTTYSRYWVGFELTLLLLLLVTISLARVSIEESYVAGVHFLPIFLMSFLVLTSIPQGIGYEQKAWVNRYDGQFAGALTEEILPEHFSISTSEMNTFGLMIDRYVIDLWGYTNRDIATSRVCNADRIRNNENFFLDTLPDIYWPYWFTNAKSRIKKSTSHNFDSVEKSFSKFHHTSKRGNLLGDMNKVLMNYNVFIIKTHGNQVAYLVRKDVGDSLINHLKEKKFKLLRSREIDMERFSSLYNSQNQVQYKCS